MKALIAFSAVAALLALLLVLGASGTLAAQPAGVPTTGSGDTTAIVTGLVSLALRLVILGGLVLLFRPKAAR